MSPLTVDSETVWIAVGLVGQLAFTARFLVQWLTSERRGESVIPIAFWYFSMAGGVILLAYAIHKVDPVFILGQSMGLVVYVRNLVLIHRRNAPPDSNPPRVVELQSPILGKAA